MSALAIRLLAAAAVLASAVLAGWRLGDHLVRGEWAAADLKRTQAEAWERAKNADRANTSAAQFEAQRRFIQTNQAEVTRDLKQSLSVPICPAGTASAALADLLVPAATVDSLRRAGADPAGH